MAKRSRVLDDVAEEQSDKRCETIKAGALGQAQDHACTLELGEHHGVVVDTREAQAQAKRGVQRVWVHRHADHADAGTDQDRGHLLGQALHYDGSGCGVLRSGGDGGTRRGGLLLLHFLFRGSHLDCNGRWVWTRKKKKFVKKIYIFSISARKSSFHKNKEQLFAELLHMK